MRRLHALPKYIYRRAYRYTVEVYRDGKVIYLGGSKKLEDAVKILKDYQEKNERDFGKI